MTMFFEVHIESIKKLSRLYVCTAQPNARGSPITVTGKPTQVPLSALSRVSRITRENSR